MVKNLALFLLWIVVTPLILAFTIYTSFKQDQSQIILENYPTVTSSEFEIDNDINSQVLGAKINDFRPLIVESFLKNTPLESYSDYMIVVADKYGIDYRLIPAIAMRESTGGKGIDQSTHNAWGWENGRTVFTSWESAIDIVGRTLKNNYIDKGLTTPEQIMVVYAPPQVYTGGKWAEDINLFFSQMESL